MRMPDWTPLWGKIVDSSLWAEEDYVVKVYLTMLAKKDWNNVVHGSAYNIAMWARKDEAEVIKALHVLSSPDTKRLEPQEFDGRRIEKVEGGWLILNGKYYRDLVKAETLKDQKAKWAQEDRDADKEARQLLKDQIDKMSPEAFEALVKAKKKILKKSKEWKKKDPGAIHGDGTVMPSDMVPPDNGEEGKKENE